MNSWPVRHSTTAPATSTTRSGWESRSSSGSSAAAVSGPNLRSANCRTRAGILPSFFPSFFPSSFDPLIESFLVPSLRPLQYLVRKSGADFTQGRHLPLRTFRIQPRESPESHHIRDPLGKPRCQIFVTGVVQQFLQLPDRPCRFRWRTGTLQRERGGNQVAGDDPGTPTDPHSKQKVPRCPRSQAVPATHAPNRDRSDPQRQSVPSMRLCHCRRPGRTRTVAHRWALGLSRPRQGLLHGREVEHASPITRVTAQQIPQRFGGG